MQGGLCVGLGVSLSFLQKSKAVNNKVSKVACGQGYYEIRSLYLCQLPHKRLHPLIPAHSPHSHTKYCNPYFSLQQSLLNSVCHYMLCALCLMKQLWD